MTRVRLQDLPPAMRERVLAQQVTTGGHDKRARPDPAGPSPPAAGSGPRYRCHTCGAEFERYGAAAERCADSHHGARLDAVLHPDTPGR